MKRFILPLLFLTFFFPAFSQSYVNVTGIVTDSATGNPIPNQAVQISSDSSGGFIYYTIVYTNTNGSYIDTALLYGPTSGILYVTTIDCNAFPITYSLPFGPGNYNLVQDFQICYSNSPCQADFTYINSAPLTLQFTDISTGTTGPWFWQFGDGSYSSQQNPAHSYPSGGTYNVSLTIGDSATSCWDMTSQTVYVVDSTGGGCVADFEAYPDSAGVNTVYFYDQSLGNILYWSWNFDDPASGMANTSTIQNPVHTFSQAGIYNVCLTIQGADSLCYDTYCEQISVGGSNNCQAQFTYYADTSGNFDLVHFIDLSSGFITSWLWDFGDGTPGSTLQNPSHIFPEEGTYYVCLTIQGMYGGSTCTSTWCNEIIVGNGSDCASYLTFQKSGLTVNFTGIMVNGQPATYSWDFGDGQSGVGQTISHLYSSSGIYFVSLTTVTQDSANCTYSSGQSITVGDSSQWNQIYGQVFAGNFPLETGIVMIFSLDTNLNYFPFIDISFVDSMGIYYFPMVPLGNYLIYAIPFNPAGYFPTYYEDAIFWEDATLVTLGQPYNPYNINLVQADSYPSGIGIINGQINTTGMRSTILDKITMLLMNEDGQAISFRQVNEEGGFDFPELDFGIYYLHAELAGCQSDYIKVELTPENPVVDVVLTFTGSEILGMSENPASLDAGVVYPNPVSNLANITVKLNEASQVYVELFNLSGQRLYQSTDNLDAGTTTITIPVSQFRDGLYTLRIYTNTGLNLTRKLLKSQ